MSEDKFTRLTTQDNFVSEKIDIIKNNLLGSYDDENQYFIAPQIVKELKELKKYKKSSFNNSAFCAGNLIGYGEIFFELEFDEQTVDENQGKANFYVLENVDKINGYLQNVIRTKIGEFVAPLEDFIQKSYAFFNIFDEEDYDEGKEKKSLEDLATDDSFILAKKQYSLMMDKLSDEEYLDAYGKYFSAKVSLLTSTDNDFCKSVLEKFNQEYEMIEKLFLANKNYKVLNELIDKCLEEVSGTKEIYLEQEKLFRDALAPELEEFSNSVEVLNERFEEKALTMLSKDDQNKVTEIIESEEQHNREIKDNGDESVVLENAESNSDITPVATEQLLQDDNPLEMSITPDRVVEEKEIEEVDSQVLGEEQQFPAAEQQAQQPSNKVDMDMMKSMFGIDPTFVDNRPVEEPEQDSDQEPLDIMDMFRRKAEILANSPEYNGEEKVESQPIEQSNSNPFDFEDQNNAQPTEISEVNANDTDKQSLSIEENRPQTQDQNPIVEDIDKETKQQPINHEITKDTSEQNSPSDRAKRQIENMNDIFNTLKAMSREKTSEKREELPSKNDNISEQPSSSQDESLSSSKDIITGLFDSSDENEKDFVGLFSQTSQQSDISSYYDKPPIFENEESIREDELYSDGLGSLFGEKFEQSTQDDEKVENETTTTIEQSDEVGANQPFSTIQDNQVEKRQSDVLVQ